MNKKASGLLDLGRKRRAERWRRYACIGDFHGGAYECEFVSPYTKSAGNVDANVMVLLQDWASEDVLAGPFLPDRVEHGYDPARGTNRRLKQRLSTHLGLELKDIYATNVFPFVKRGAQNAPVPMRDLVRVAREFALPQIEIVSPILAICLGRAAFAAVVRAMGQRPPATIDASIRTPARMGSTQVWCQAHTGSIGTNNRNKGGIDRVSQDWAAMAMSNSAMDPPGLSCGGHRARICAGGSSPGR